MPQQTTEAPVQEPVAPPSPRPAKTRPSPKIEPKTRHLPPWGVILHNDDINSFTYVVRVIRQVFGYGFIKAFRLTLEAHRTGRALVWTGHRELAELMADKIVSCGPDQSMRHKNPPPLGVSVEPLPEE